MYILIAATIVLTEANPVSALAVEAQIEPHTTQSVAVKIIDSSSWQSQKRCTVCERADSLVRRGDTLSAIALLREEVSRTATDELWGRLGLLLARIAPARETDADMREEAEKALDRAVKLDSFDPRWQYGYGLLYQKRRVDETGKRFFHRALELHERADDASGLSREELADVHARLGRILEEWILHFRGFIGDASPLLPNSTDCGKEATWMGAFCENFNSPTTFHERLFRIDPFSDLVSDDHQQMRRHYQAAYRLNPAHSLASRGLLADHARHEEWDQFVTVARGYVQARPEEGWPRVFLGAGRHRLGDHAGAARSFSTGIDLLPGDESAALRSISQIVTKAEEERLSELSRERREAYEKMMWALSDPFYLTTVNERRLEHWTRTALAELWFGEEPVGQRGYESDRGVILIRYGSPQWIRQVRRDEETARMAAEASNPTWSEFPVNRATEFGGRWIFWIYRMDMPSFIFEQQLGRRKVKHAFLTESLYYTQGFRATTPSLYVVPGATELAHQVVRFRGRRTPVEVDLFLELPRDTTAPPRGGRAGVFFLPRSPEASVAGLESEVKFGPGQRVATFRIPLEPGRYPYSVEAISNDEALKSRDRGSLDFENFAVRGFGISDILLATQIVPRTATEKVRDRRDLRFAPEADLEFLVGSPISVYFEVYDLQFESGDGVSTQGTYNVRVQVEETSNPENPVRKLFRIIGGFLGRQDEGTVVSWERTVAESRQKVPEWFGLTLPTATPGQYKIRVEVEDVRTGNRARTERLFSVAAY